MRHHVRVAVFACTSLLPAGACLADDFCDGLKQVQGQSRDFSPYRSTELDSKTFKSRYQLPGLEADACTLSRVGEDTLGYDCSVYVPAPNPTALAAQALAARTAACFGVAVPDFRDYGDGELDAIFFSGGAKISITHGTGADIHGRTLHLSISHAHTVGDP